MIVYIFNLIVYRLNKIVKITEVLEFWLMGIDTLCSSAVFCFICTIDLTFYEIKCLTFHYRD